MKQLNQSLYSFKGSLSLRWFVQFSTPGMTEKLPAFSKLVQHCSLDIAVTFQFCCVTFYFETITSSVITANCNVVSL